LDVKATQPFRDKSSRYVYNAQPIFQTKLRPIDLPTEAQLKSSLGLMLISTSKFDHTATLDSKTYRAGTWQVAAVPVRATDKSCINCHFRFSNFKSKPRLGDPLGIALYAFRSTAGRPTRTTSVSLPPALPSHPR
jgi:hypothetical protein